jgi:lipopolysaccharide export LptBFGC system permease protein LptF
VTRRRSPLTLSHIVERIAGVCPPQHRELTRGMVAELASIANPAERARFALGAIAAIARLAVRGYCRTIAHAPGLVAGVREPEYRTNVGGRSMQRITTPQLLRRHAVPFAISFASLTLLMLAIQAVRRVPQLSARGEPVGTIVEWLLLSVGYIVPITLPLAVFLTVSWVFTRLRAEGVLVPALRVHHGILRLVFPVLGAASVIATLTFVSISQVTPRTNARLMAVFAGAQVQPTDRTMTIGELREAARSARTETGSDAIARAAAYEVEIQKKFALAAACVILALAGAATAIRFPHGRVGLVLGSSGVVFVGYYLLTVVGESLADRQVLSPLVAMWMANAFLLAVALLLVWRPSHPGPTRGAKTLVIGG